MANLEINSFVQNYIEDCSSLLSNGLILNEVEKAVSLLKKCKANGGKVIFAGNGASASIANHASLDFTKQAKIRSVNFNESAFITAFANDFGYENWLAKAVEFHSGQNDLLVLISCSGTSSNIVNAAELAKSLQLPVLSFTGFAYDNPTKVASDVAFWVDSKAYNIIEGVHQIWLLMLCDIIIGRTEYPVS